MRLLDVAPTLQTKVLYALDYTAGLRFGELASLTWGNIDWEKGELVIENRSATANMPPLSVKDYEARRIPLPKHTLDILRELQTKALFKCPFVLLDVGRELRRHLKKAGIKPNGSLSSHTLRKCAGKNWADVLPPHVTKELMGHSSIATTMKFYSQVDASQRTRAAAAVDSLIAKVGKENDAQLTPKANLAP